MQAENVISIEDIKHAELLQHIRAVLTMESGDQFIKYLFKSFGVMQLPYEFCKGEELIERLAIHRCGQAIYKIVSEANQYKAGVLLAEIERERFDARKNDTNPQEG